MTNSRSQLRPYVMAGSSLTQLYPAFCRSVALPEARGETWLTGPYS